MRAALFTLVLVLALARAAPAPGAGTLGVHGMVYLDSPAGFKEAMFAQADDLGAAAIRVDVDVSAIVTGGGRGRRWDEFDTDIALARRYPMEVLGVILGTPESLARCDPSVPRFFRFRCPATDERRYAAHVREIVTRARGAIDAWQVLSEPDNPLVFHGSVEAYGRRLVDTARAIHAANPAATVVLGDLGSPHRHRYLSRLLELPGVRGSYDVAAIDLRGGLHSVLAALHHWRRWHARGGFHGPIWVTEHGYPADPAYQWDPRFNGGDASQASYLSHSLPGLLRAGAQCVFVTLRDSRGGPWASEGLLTGSVLDPPPPHPVAVRRPAAVVFQRLARPLRGRRTLR
jgi:hypothetical protein